MPPRPRATYVSPCVKYMIFLLNFVFWLFGCLLYGIGFYAFLDKYQTNGGYFKLDTVYDVILNVSLLLIILGAIIFIVSFAGFVGALRENTCLLKFYSLSLLIFFLLEMAVAVVGFVFPHAMQATLEESFTDRIIRYYRDDADLQNFIDFAQQEFKCCGLSSDGFVDWSKNEYFNCSSPSVEQCGVPFSCCINTTEIASGLPNIMCGYGTQKLSVNSECVVIKEKVLKLAGKKKKFQAEVAEAGKKIWTSGCIEVVRSFAERNLYTIGAVALGVALAQLLIINLAKTLEGQIELQKSGWSS